MRQSSRLLLDIDEAEEILRNDYGVDDSFIERWRSGFTHQPSVKPLRIDREAVLSQNNGNCVYCGKAANSVDHVIPKSKGGTNDPRNLVPACMDCNRRKKDKVNWSC